MTGLEIVDSAIKIGLGALISGVSTFLVTRKNHAHDLEKMARDDKKYIIREVSTLLEDGTSNINRCIHEYWKVNEGRVDLTVLLESLNEINRARALAAISGSQELFDAVSKYSKVLLEFYVYLNEVGQAYDGEKANGFVGSINSHWGNIHPILMKTYQNIWSDT